MEALSFDSTPLEARFLERNTNHQMLPVFKLDLHQANSAERETTEHFIYQRFASQYGAEIRGFLPFLLSASNEKGISAALGFQTASDNKLFLEQYLDCDIETTLGLITHNIVERDSIVEIGNLASGRQRATQTLFLLLAQILHDAGYGWVVFTANRAVKTWLARMQLSAFIIKEADPNLLTDKSVKWGSYYDDRPVVLAANIEHSFSSINEQPLMAQLRDSYGSQINRFKAQLIK
ncbi:thermostable hemolysin [Methylophaga sp.]|uniref:thermostable hemolysin n=1 Tax=Methylophaga sp. TaxID=2024840 RepID=UPI003F697A97